MLAYTSESSAEYARTLNVSDVVYSIRSVHKLLSSYQDRHIQNTVKHVKDGMFCKKNNA